MLNSVSMEGVNSLFTLVYSVFCIITSCDADFSFSGRDELIHDRLITAYLPWGVNLDKIMHVR